MGKFFETAIRYTLGIFCFCAASVITLGAVPVQPVTVKDLCLMLRSGYTADEVLRETAARPLLEPLDANAEKALWQAGANARLVGNLKAGHRALSGAEAAAAREHQAELDRTDLEARQASQARLAEMQQQAAMPMPRAAGGGSTLNMAELLHGKLVSLRDGQLRPYDEATLGKTKFFAMYFSASWCGPCRKFTPQFVEFYKKYAPTHPEMEVVFISDDRSPADMANYMRQDGMTWPALAFERKEQEAALTRYAGSGIPDLVVVDATGQVLSDSYQGRNYLGPQKVLADLGRMISSGN